VEHGVGDIRVYAEQSSGLEHRETQPRHLPELSLHTYCERCHTYLGAGLSARVNCVAFLRRMPELTTIAWA
jgi:hypothetical protein